MAAAARVSHTAAAAGALAARLEGAQEVLAEADPERARLAAWRAEMLSQAHAHRAAKDAIDAAIEGFIAASQRPWLAEAAIVRIGIYGRFGELAPAPPGVAKWLSEGPAARMRVAFARAVADSGLGDPAQAEAAALAHLDEMWPHLDGHHQLLWRLVPWVARAHAQRRMTS